MSALFEASAEELQRKSVKDLVAVHHISFFFKRVAMTAAGEPRPGAPSGRRGSGGALGVEGAGDGRPRLLPNAASFRRPGGDLAPQSVILGPGAGASLGANLALNANDFDDEESRLIEAVHLRDGASFQVVATIRKITAGSGALLLVMFEPRKEKAGEGLISADARGVILSVNRAAAAMFGYEPHELLKERLEILMPLPYSKLHEGFVRDYVRTGVSRAMGTKRSLEGLHKSGTTFPVSITLSRAEINGEVILTGTMLKLEQKDETDEDVYITINQQGTIQSIRGPVVEMFGFRPNELVGRSLNTLLPRNVAAIHDQYIKRLVEKPSEPRVIGTGGRTIEAVRKDGSPFPIQIDITANDYLKASGVMLFVGRITQLLDLDALITVDAAGRIVSCNYATYRIFGYSDVQDLTGTDIARLLPGFPQLQDAAASSSGRPGTILEATASGGPGEAGRGQEAPGSAVVGKHASGHQIPLNVELSVSNVGGVPYTSVHLRYRNDRRRSRLSVDIPNRGADPASPIPTLNTPAAESESSSLPSAAGPGPGVADARRRSSGSQSGQAAPRIAPLMSIAEGADGAPSAERGHSSSARGRPAATGPGLAVEVPVIARQSPKLLDAVLSPGSAPPSPGPAAAPAAARSAPPEPNAKPEPKQAKAEAVGQNGTRAGEPIATQRPAHGAATQSVTSSKTSQERRRKRRRRVLAMLSTRPNALVKRLWRDLVICQIVLAAMVVCTFVAVTQIVDQYAGHLVHLSTSSRRTVLSQLMAIETRTLGLALGMALGPQGTPRLWDMAGQFIDVHQDLTFGLHGFDPPDDENLTALLFSPAALPVVELRDRQLVTTRAGLWTIGSRYHHSAAILCIAGLARSGALPNSSWSQPLAAARIPQDFLPDSIARSASASALADSGASDADPARLGIKCAANLTECTSWYYVIKNGPFSILAGLDDVTSMYVYMMRASAKLLEGMFVAVLVAGFVLLAVSGCGAFYPTFSRVLVQRDEIMVLFLHIPRAAVRGLSKKRVDVALNSSESSEGELGSGSERGADEPAPPAEQAADERDDASADGTRSPATKAMGDSAADQLAARLASALSSSGPAEGPSGAPGHGHRASRVVPRGARGHMASPMHPAPPAEDASQPPASASLVGWLRSRLSQSISGAASPVGRRGVRPIPSVGPRDRPRFASASSRLFGRQLLRLYIAGSCLVAAFIIAIFVSGYRTVTTLDDAASHIVMASSLRGIALRLVAGARATILPSLRTPEVEAAAAAAKATGNLDAALAFGVSSGRPWEVSAADVRAMRATLADLQDTFKSSVGLSALMFSSVHAFGDAGGSPAAGLTGEGLHALLTLFADQAEELASAPPAERAASNPSYQFVWSTGLTSVLTGLAALEREYSDLAAQQVRAVVPVHGGLMAATLVVLLLVTFLQVRPMVRRLRDETRRAHRMLQLIPDGILERVEAICAYVDRHAQEAED